jgi:ParB family transcriptional regulator, chromosome partitioning protein
MAQAVLEIGIDEVMPDPGQPRKSFPPEEIDRMAVSIDRRGLLLPIRVRRDDERKSWLIVNGECRWRAARQAGLKTVPCLAVMGEMSEADILTDQIIENTVRNSLRPLELARSLCKLKALKGWNSSKLAAETGITGAGVTRAEGILEDLPPEVQAMVDDGRVPESTAYEISRLPDDESKLALAHAVVARKLNRDAVAQIVRDGVGTRKSTPKGSRLAMRPGDGMSVSITACQPLTWDGLFAALDRIRKEGKKLCDGNKPVAELAKTMKG